MGKEFNEYFMELAKTISAEYQLMVFTAIMLLFIVITAIIVRFVMHRVILRVIKQQEQIRSNIFTSTLVEERLFERVALLLQGFIVYLQTKLWLEGGAVYEILITVSVIWMQFIGLLISFSLLDKLFKVIHKTTQIQFFSMRTVSQTIKLIIGIVFVVQLISTLVGKSPVAVLSGLGALSAVLMLIFKDTILGFTAGLQLSTNKMVELGDWIEMPKYGADGDVIDIGLTTVKVRNFDKTITTIPTYALVSDSFKNWRGMRESGGRRIKRPVVIDINSIAFLTEEDKKRLKKASLLAPYLEQKEREIEEHNESFDMSTTINGRRLTNLGTFRAYVQTYLKNHKGINQDMMVMVRQLAPSHFGLPLEIYCFTSTTVWTEYENIQSDIFDHIFSVLPEFGLKSYQVGSVVA